MADVADLIEKAGSHLERDQFEQAIAVLEQAVKLDPTNGQAWYFKGCAHSSRNELQAAVDCYKKSAQFAGERAALPLFNLGNAYQALGRIDEAKQAFRECLEKDPEMADAWINIGRLLDDGGEHKAAINCYHVALQHQPGDNVALSNMGNSYRALGLFEDALASYEKALQAGPEEPRILFEKALILGTLDRYEEGVKSIDRAIELGCNAPEAWNNRAEMLAKLHRVDESIASFDKALTIDPEFAPAWFGKARVLFNSGQKAQAAIAIQKYFALSTDKDEVHESARALQVLLANG